MPLTQAERNFSQAMQRYQRVMRQLYNARENYLNKSHALRRERGMDPPAMFGQLNRDYALEHLIKNKSARTIQRYKRASTARRRAAFAGSLSRTPLYWNIRRKIFSPSPNRR